MVYIAETEKWKFAMRFGGTKRNYEDLRRSVYKWNEYYPLTVGAIKLEHGFAIKSISPHAINYGTARERESERGRVERGERESN